MAVSPPNDLRSIIKLDVSADDSAEARSDADIDGSRAPVILPGNRPLPPRLVASEHLPQEASDSIAPEQLARAITARPHPGHIDEIQEDRSASAPRLSTRQLEVVRDYIDRNLAEAISVRNLAANAGMSRAEFSRRFNASTSMTPHQAVTAARIERAKALLLDKAMSIGEVAKRSGFCAASHLSSVFRRTLKMSPSDYRAQTTSAEAPRSLRNACDVRPPSPIARPTLSPIVPEFTIEQTTLYSGNSRQLVASSQGLGWSDLFAAVTEELPHDTLHRAIPDVWLASALTPVDIQRIAPRYEQNQLLPKGTITITGPDDPVYDKTAAALKVAYVFLRREVIDSVAEELFRDCPDRRHVNSLLRSNDAVLQRLVASIVTLLNEPAEHGRLKVDYLSQALAARLLENHSVVGPVRSTPPVHSFNSIEIARVVEYINENLASNMSVGELARLVGLGRAQFILRFKATTGLTPHQFVICQRIYRARDLLAHADWDQDLIAQHCGFADSSHFIASFRRVVGMTPREYRQLVTG